MHTRPPCGRRARGGDRQASQTGSNERRRTSRGPRGPPPGARRRRRGPGAGASGGRSAGEGSRGVLPGRLAWGQRYAWVTGGGVRGGQTRAKPGRGAGGEGGAPMLPARRRPGGAARRVRARAPGAAPGRRSPRAREKRAGPGGERLWGGLRAGKGGECGRQFQERLYIPTTAGPGGARLARARPVRGHSRRRFGGGRAAHAERGAGRQAWWAPGAGPRQKLFIVLRGPASSGVGSRGNKRFMRAAGAARSGLASVWGAGSAVVVVGASTRP
jgi:hypothetical protein